MTATFEIEDHYHLQFTSTVEMELQRKGPKLLPFVTQEGYTGEKAQVVNKYGEVEMQELNTRHADTEWSDVSRTQRWIHPREHALHLPVDRTDRLKMLHDPQNPLIQAGTAAVGRKIDDLIVSSFFGTSYAGVQGTDSITWGNDVYGEALDMTVDVNYVESGSATNSGLTIGKLRKAHAMLVDNEIDLEVERPVFVGTVDQKMDLLKTTEVTSSDYNTIKALVNGEVNDFLGFHFVWVSKALLQKSGSNRRCAAFVPGALVFGQWEGLQTRISDRADKNHTTQISMYMTNNATRVDEKRIVEILCLEA